MFQVSISSTLYARIFRTNFSPKQNVTRHVTREKLPKQHSYEKFVLLTLMKLTPAHNLRSNNFSLFSNLHYIKRDKEGENQTTYRQFHQRFLCPFFVRTSFLAAFLVMFRLWCQNLVRKMHE